MEPQKYVHAFARYGSESIASLSSNIILSLAEVWDFTLATPDLIHPIPNSNISLCFVSGITNASALSTIYLTSDKTITGTVLFSRILGGFPVGISNVSPGVNTPNVAVQQKLSNGIIVATTKGVTNLLGLTTSINPAPNTAFDMLILAQR